MQNKTGKNLSCILGAVIIILLTAQMIAGLIWGVLNFPFIQEYPDAGEMYRLSSSLKLETDTSIIYPALLLLVRTLTADSEFASAVVMYLIQLCLGFTAWYVFAKDVIGFKKKWIDVWFSLAVLTCPYAMQCHLAVLEYSFVSSFLCLLLTFQIRFSREWKKEGNTFGLDRALRDISVTSLFWLLLGLTRKEFFFIGAIPVLVLLIMMLERFKAGNGLKKIAPIGVALAFAGIIFMTDGLFRDHELHTFSDVVKRALYIREAWSEDLNDEYTWPEYITSLSDDEDRYRILHHVRSDAGAVRTWLTPYVASCIGEAETSNSYLVWGVNCFKDNKRKIVKYLALDMVGYVFPPLETEIILRGSEYPGFVATEYDVMSRHTPVFTKYYLRTATVIYILLYPVTILLWILARKKGKANFKLSGIVLTVASCSVIYSFYGSNVWDPRKALFATCMWIAAAALEGIALFEHGMKEDKA